MQSNKNTLPVKNSKAFHAHKKIRLYLKILNLFQAIATADICQNYDIKTFLIT